MIVIHFWNHYIELHCLDIDNELGVYGLFMYTLSYDGKIILFNSQKYTL